MCILRETLEHLCSLKILGKWKELVRAEKYSAVPLGCNTWSGQTHRQEVVAVRRWRVRTSGTRGWSFSLGWWESSRDGCGDVCTILWMYLNPKIVHLKWLKMKILPYVYFTTVKTVWSNCRYSLWFHRKQVSSRQGPVLFKSFIYHGKNTQHKIIISATLKTQFGGIIHVPTVTCSPCCYHLKDCFSIPDRNSCI